MLRFGLIGYLLLVSCLAGHGQSPLPSTMTFARQRLLLEQAASFILVKRLSRIDIDSGLSIVHEKLHVSKFSLIAEGLDTSLFLSNAGWIDEDQPALAVQRLSTLKGTPRLQLLQLLGAYYAFRPNGYKNFIDSAIGYITLAIKESEFLHNPRARRQSLCLLGKVYAEKRDTVMANQVFRRLIDDCRSSGDNTTEARAWKYYGAYFPYLSQTAAQRTEYLRRALDLYRRQQDVCNTANVLMDIGYLSYFLYHLADAKAAFLASVNLQDSISWPYTHYSTDLLTLVSDAEGKYGDQMRYSLRSVRSAEASNDSIGLSVFYVRLADGHSMLDNSQQEALVWYKKAAAVCLAENAPPATIYNIFNRIVHDMHLRQQDQEALILIDSIHRQHPPIDDQDFFEYNWLMACLYKFTKQYKLAEAYALRAQHLEKPMELVSGPINTGAIFWILGDIYKDEKQYTAAEACYRSLLASPYIHRVHRSASRSAIIRSLLVVDSALGKTAAALADYHTYVELKEEHFNAMQGMRADELMVQYETEQREKNIQLLTAQAKLQQTELKQSAFARSIAYAGVALALLLAGLIYSRFRIKQKSNRELEKQREEIAQKNVQLQHLIDAKEWLLKEVHHRVKNNLQIVMSLLYSQSAYLQDEKAISAVLESQHRVQAMALIHQKLYKSDHANSIYMPEYITDLVEYLKNGFNIRQSIWFDLQIEKINLDILHAVPVGLILNEAITNAIKYAFPHGEDDHITVRLFASAPDEITLIIKDNGRGIPAGSELGTSGSFGMTLIKGLTEDMDGSLFITSGNGTTLHMVFMVVVAPEKKLQMA